jgi:hypothetical protein
VAGLAVQLSAQQLGGISNAPANVVLQMQL